MNRNEKFHEFFDELQLDIEVMDFIDPDYIHTFNDIVRSLERNSAFRQEVIYYYNAIKYLSEHDPSLRESLGLAHELGYSIDKLSSEDLASELMTHNYTVNFYNHENEIEEFLTELNEENE